MVTNISFKKIAFLKSFGLILLVNNVIFLRALDAADAVSLDSAYWVSRNQVKDKASNCLHCLLSVSPDLRVIRLCAEHRSLSCRVFQTEFSKSSREAQRRREAQLQSLAQATLSRPSKRSLTEDPFRDCFGEKVERTDSRAKVLRLAPSLLPETTLDRSEILAGDKLASTAELDKLFS